MTEFLLEATPRIPRGKGGARQLRREGLVPGVVYGVQDPIAVQVQERAAFRLLHQDNIASHVVTLRLPKTDGGDRRVLVKEIQTTPIGGKLVHIDFNEIATDTKVRVDVELRTVGTPAGLLLGGTQQMIMHVISVECLPDQLPDAIEVDVSALEIGHSLHIGDIKFPEGVRPLAEPDAAVIVISGRMREEVEVTEAIALEEGALEEGAAEAGKESPAEEGAE